MKTRYLISLATLVFLLSACIPSVHPFYLEKDLVFDARLLGEWQPKTPGDGAESWKFERDGDMKFTLTLTEKDKTGVFTAHLFRLKNQHFIDLTPKECDFAPGQMDLVAATLISGHLIMRVSEMEPLLKIAFSDFDWLEKYLKANPKALAHRRDDDQIVLTASTAELQRFVLKHLGEKELFSKFNELVRKNEPAAAPK